MLVFTTYCTMSLHNVNSNKPNSYFLQGKTKKLNLGFKSKLLIKMNFLNCCWV